MIPTLVTIAVNLSDYGGPAMEVDLTFQVWPPQRATYDDPEQPSRAVWVFTKSPPIPIRDRDAYTAALNRAIDALESDPGPIMEGMDAD